MKPITKPEEDGIVQLLKRFPTQIMSSININVSTFMVGGSISLGAVMEGRIEEGNDVIHLSPEEISWIVSSLMLGMLVSSFFCGQIAEKFGIKGCVIFANCAQLFGFLFIIFGTNLFGLAIGRFVLGTGIVANRMSAQSLICEISKAKIRSVTGCIWFMAYTLGQCMTFLLASLLPWRLAVEITLIPLLLSTFAMFFLHESPIWLLKQGQEEKAELSLRFYGRDDCEAIFEIASIKEFLTTEEHTSIKGTFMESLKLKYAQMSEPSFLKPCLYLIVSMVATHWSCFSFFSSYTVSIFKITKTPFDPYVLSSIATTSRFVGSLASGAILSQFPRRSIFLTSGIIILLCLSTLGFYTYLQTLDILSNYVRHLAWLPLINVIIIYVASSIGYMNIPLLLIGEILPAETKTLGNAIVLCFEFSAMFFMVKSVPFLLENLKIFGMFWLFSGVVTFVIIFAFLFMPESQNLSLQEIQKSFGKRKKLTE